MPYPDSLGASGRYLEFDLTAVAYPFRWAEDFAAAYPLDADRLAVQSVSRTIVALGGSGDIEFITAAPGAPTTVLQFAQGEANAIQAVGIQALPAAVTDIKVYL